jgi:hypothetical protein
MFIGHFALGFAAKRLAPTVSLGTLFLACQFADLLWPTLLLFGIETVDIDPGNTLMTPLNFISYPYSHSLVMLLVWSALFALVYRIVKGSHRAAMITLAALVFSHYVLDVITHRPDMPVTINGTTRLGLGLWNHPGTALTIESAMFIVGTAFYTSATRATDRIGRIGLWALIVVMVALFFAALYGPPPPSTAALAVGGHFAWLFVLWAYWVDRHRVTIGHGASSPRDRGAHA